jgi:hypothetical protein
MAGLRRRDAYTTTALGELRIFAGARRFDRHATHGSLALRLNERVAHRVKVLAGDCREADFAAIAAQLNAFEQDMAGLSSRGAR